MRYMCFYVIICVYNVFYEFLMRFWCVFYVFYAFLMHFPSFVRADRVPAALRRPRKKHDPDFFIKFVCVAPCLRRFGDLKKTTFLDC